MRTFTSTVLIAVTAVALTACSANAAQHSTSVPTGELGTYVLASEADYSTTEPARRPFIFRHMDEVDHNPTVQVRHGSELRTLTAGAPVNATVDIDGVEETLDSFMDRFSVSSLMVVKDGQIRTERYQYGNLPSSQSVVQSVTKSVVSTALGIAIKDGAIGSTDDPITKYIPELAGTPADGAGAVLLFCLPESDYISGEVVVAAGGLRM